MQKGGGGGRERERDWNVLFLYIIEARYKSITKF